MPDGLIAAALAETIGGCAVEALVPIVRRASRAIRKNSQSQQQFITGYNRYIKKQRENLDVLSAYADLPPSISLATLKRVLTSPTARGFTQTLVAIYITGRDEYVQQTNEYVNEYVRQQSIYANQVARNFREYFIDQMLYSVSVSGANDSDDDSWSIGDSRSSSKQEFARLADVSFEILNKYSQSVAEYLAQNESVQDRAITWAQATLANEILQSIERYTALAAGEATFSAEQRNRWVASYRDAFVAKHRKIPLPDLRTRRSIDYKDLYVAPTIRGIAKEGSSSTLILPDVNLDRIVILGDPGAGKSTATSVMAVEGIGLERPVPFYLVMREINVSEAGFSLIDTIEKRLKESYQISPIPGLVEALLLEGAAVLFFDGLDELLDSRVRKKAADVIEAVCTRFPLASVVVTCRHVGYAEARLNADFFDEFEILPFSNDQVREYVTNWFKNLDEPTKGTVKSIAERFMDLSKGIEDLRNNPLLLSFVCVMYRGNRYIPRNRPQLYRKCIELLLGEWDVARGLTDELVDLSTYQLALAEVANVVSSQGAYIKSIPFGVLINVITDHLQRDAGYPLADAHASAAKILDLCKGRAWIFTDVGLTADGEELYAFTHASFREYFYAWYLSRITRDPEHLADELYALLREGRSEVAVQIAINICETNDKNGGSRCTLELANKLAEADPSEMSDASKTAAFTAIWDGVDAVYLQEPALFALERSMIWEIVGSGTRSTEWLTTILGSDLGHGSRAILMYPDVVRSLVGVGGREEQLRLCWLCNEAESYMPSDVSPNAFLAPIDKFISDPGSFDDVMTIAGTDTSDLAWHLGVRWGRAASSAAQQKLSTSLIRRIFAPCNSSSMAGVGNSITAFWAIEKMASSNRWQTSVSACHQLLRTFGDISDPRHFVNGLVLSNFERHRLQNGVNVLFANKTIDRAFGRCAGFDIKMRQGLTLLAIIALDVFNQFFASRKRASLDDIERKFLVSRDRLVAGSWDFPDAWRTFIDGWWSGSIWQPVDEGFGVS